MLQEKKFYGHLAVVSVFLILPSSSHFSQSRLGPGTGVWKLSILTTAAEQKTKVQPIVKLPVVR